MISSAVGEIYIDWMPEPGIEISDWFKVCNGSTDFRLNFDTMPIPSMISG